MNVVNYLLAAVALGSSVAMAECVPPTVPNVPDGASSTFGDMQNGRKAVESFQAANVDYMNCLDSEIDAATNEIESGNSIDAKVQKVALEKLITAYNDAISVETELAEQFNRERMEYNEAVKGD